MLRSKKMWTEKWKQNSIWVKLVLLVFNIICFGCLYLKVINPILLDHKYNYSVIFVVFFLCFFLISCIAIFNFTINLDKLHVITFPIIVLWGIIYLFILPPFTAPDEIAHFVTANYYANEIMGVREQQNTEETFVREKDIQDIIKYPTGQQIDEFYNAEFSGSSQYVVFPQDYPKRLTTFSFNYIPQSLGIIFARLLQLDYLGLVLMGRFFNLLAFAGLVSLSIKLLPIGKISLFIICQFPMTLELAASYSYDAICISLSFLFISYALHLINKKQNKRADLILLLLLGMIMTPIKALYIPLVGLVFLISSKSVDIKKKWFVLYKVAFVFLCGLMILVINFSSIARVLGISTKTTETVVIQEEAVDVIESETATATSSNIEIPDEMVPIEEKEYYSLQSIINDPQIIIPLIKGTFSERTGFYILSSIGAYLGWLDIKVMLLPIYIFLILFILSLFYVEKEHSNIRFSLKEKVFLFLIPLSYFVVIHMLMLITCTDIGASGIQGVQGRYFIPFLPLGYFFFQRNRIRINKYIDKIIFCVLPILNMLVVYSCIKEVLLR